MTALALVVLSPHFDDAAFSCGGALALARRRGEDVAVVTVCAAPPAGPLSPYAASLHRRWGAPAGGEQADAAAMVARRRAEDGRALATLGVPGHYLDIPDCIYRRGPDGAWLYQSDDEIFGAVAPADATTEAAIARHLQRLAVVDRGCQLLLPLGIGNHVDHQLARRAGEQLAAAIGCPVAYYEDYPYVDDAAARDAALRRNTGLAPVLLPLDAAALNERIRASAAYSSQIESFWADGAAMARSVRASARRTGGAAGPAERWWRRPAAAAA